MGHMNIDAWVRAIVERQNISAESRKKRMTTSHNKDLDGGDALKRTLGKQVAALKTSHKLMSETFDDDTDNDDEIRSMRTYHEYRKSKMFSAASKLLQRPPPSLPPKLDDHKRRAVRGLYSAMVEAKQGRCASTHLGDKLEALRQAYGVYQMPGTTGVGKSAEMAVEASIYTRAGISSLLLCSRRLLVY